MAEDSERLRPSRTCRVVVVGDDAVFAQALALRLDREPRVDVISVVATVPDAIDAAAGQPADAVLLDVGTTTSFDVAAVQALVEGLSSTRPPCHVVAVAADDDPRAATAALLAGAAAFVPASCDLDVLVGALHGAGMGETYVPPMLLTRVFDVLRHDPSTAFTASPLDALTKRERELLELLASGADRRCIATALGLSSNTVRTHIRRVLAKLEVHSTLEAVSLALRAGVTPRRLQRELSS